MNFQDFQSTHQPHNYEEYRRTWPMIRYGQWLMNELHQANPAIYHSFSGERGDCYYFDYRIDAFWEELALAWY
jgi:hypothetical protein